MLTNAFLLVTLQHRQSQKDRIGVRGRAFSSSSSGRDAAHSPYPLLENDARIRTSTL